MPTDKKLIIAILVLAGLGGAVFMQKQRQTADAAAHSLEGAGLTLPKITVTDDDIKKIDKVELTRPIEHDGGAPEHIVLVKKGEEDWALDKPAPAKGNASNVKSMLDALKAHRGQGAHRREQGLVPEVQGERRKSAPRRVLQG